MAVVRVRYYGSGSVRRGVEYITQREESIAGGRRRPLYGVGERFRALQHKPAAAAELLEHDGARVPAARWYRLHLTVEDQRAALLQELAPTRVESVLRSAVERTLREVLPLAEGVYVTHSHSTFGRRFGHPHVHVHLSPRGGAGSGIRIDRRRLVGLRAAWDRAVDLAIGAEVARQSVIVAERGPGQRNAVLQMLAAVGGARRHPQSAVAERPAPGTSGIGGRLADGLTGWASRGSERERTRR